MNIPPSLALLLSICLGIIIGSSLTYQYIDKKQITANVNQIEKDSVTDEEISLATEVIKENNTVAKTVRKYKDKKVYLPVELTNEEIDIMCTNAFVPDDIMQSIRSEASKARKRLKDL